MPFCSCRPPFPYFLSGVPGPGYGLDVFPIRSISSVSITAVVLQVPYNVTPYKKGIAACWGLVSRSAPRIEHGGSS